MKRNIFLKSLLGLFVSPKLIQEIDWGYKSKEKLSWRVDNSKERVRYFYQNGDVVDDIERIEFEKRFIVGEYYPDYAYCYSIERTHDCFWSFTNGELIKK